MSESRQERASDSAAHADGSSAHSERVRAAARIRTGMGGWSYPGWRETFYPHDVPARRELEYASRQVNAIEINSTFYRLPKPDILLRWRDQTPDDFVFTVKASRGVVHRKDLAETGESVLRFANGVAALAPKLGAILWQLPSIKRFVADELAAFLSLLPESAGGVRLRHALEVRHRSFECAELLSLVKERNVALVLADTDAYPSFADLTSDFVYGRLMRSSADEATGYSAASLQAWAERARAWAHGDEPNDLRKLQPRAAPQRPRDVFLFFIGGAKERAPLAARALAERVRAQQR